MVWTGFDKSKIPAKESPVGPLFGRGIVQGSSKRDTGFIGIEAATPRVCAVHLPATRLITPEAPPLWASRCLSFWG